MCSNMPHLELRARDIPVMTGTCFNWYAVDVRDIPVMTGTCFNWYAVDVRDIPVMTGTGFNWYAVDVLFTINFYSDLKLNLSTNDLAYHRSGMM